MIHQPIDYYIDRLRKNDVFSLVSFGDAEWFCVLKHTLGKATGLGQILSGDHGDKLTAIMRRRQHDPRFLFSSPIALWTWDAFTDTGITQKIESFMADHKLDVGEWYERDMMNDDLANAAGLNPFIRQLRDMRTVVIGNKDHRGLDFLKYDHFVEISSPNLHMEEHGIDTAVTEAQSFGEAVYLISAGVSAAVIIDRLHDQLPTSFLIDCGSIWDAFVGIGGQREWRAALYKNKALLRQWREHNLRGL